MFKKPFRVKNQVQLKSSEKKKLFGELKQIFPTLTDDDIAFFSSQESIIKMKVLTFCEEQVEVYLVEKVPMFFELDEPKKKLPTVYMCWQFPHVVFSFTTYKPVLDKLKGGADLFLPGVCTDTAQYRNQSFEGNEAVAVNTEVNAAAGAVGLSWKSKREICYDLGGKIVKVYHCVGDYLCKVHAVSMPQLGPPLKYSSCVEEEHAKNGETDVKATDGIPASVDIQVELTPNAQLEETLPEDSTVATDVSEKEKMNELMEYCFLKAVKYSPKSIYPILPATFFANHMLTCLPPGENLNVKKTKWKKFSVFLKEIADEKMIKLESLQKNEFRIAGVETGHPAIRQFIDKYNLEPVTVEVKPSSTGQPTVQQVYAVTAATVPFFAKHGLRKGDELTRNDVRNAVNDYVKRENLQDPVKQDGVVLDPVMYSVLRVENMTRAELLSSLLDKMSIQHKVSTGGDEGNTTVHKGKMPMVEFEVVTRSGNKKVTLISNLEVYGVDFTVFTKDLQQKAAASTSVTACVPGKKGPQVQVQGNQILQAARLLEEKFGVQEKFMRGLEKAPKSKKK